MKEVYRMDYQMNKSLKTGIPEIHASGWLVPALRPLEYPAGVYFDAKGDVLLSDAGASRLYVSFVICLLPGRSLRGSSAVPS